MFHGTILKELTSHEEWSHYNENIVENQKDFVFVKFSGLHLKSVESLQSCISLRVCIFSNNFITDIYPLQNCIKLIKLDLHGNQIKTLPDTKFWNGLKNLKLLYLHDNGFAKLKNVCVLSACPNLIALTMFDCPVSLKQGYRHVLVNSIWALKALDHHVISDEEIIQNWHLPERFKTFNHRLFFNFCPALKKGSSYEDEINNIKFIISRINTILAHNSPVLIVQRWIRGFLVRKELRTSLLFKKHQGKVSKAYEGKWFYRTRGYQEKIFEDIIRKGEANIRGSITPWKSSIDSSIDLKYYSEQRKHTFPLLYELKQKDIDKKLKQSRYFVQKGQKEFGGETKNGRLDDSFQLSTFKLPIYTSDELKYVTLLKKERQAYFPTYAELFSTSHAEPIIKKDPLSVKNITQSTSVKFQIFNDIDQYFITQKKEEQHKEKITATAMAQVAQRTRNMNIHEKLNNKRYTTQKRFIRDNETVQKCLKQCYQDRLHCLKKARHRGFQFLKEKNLKIHDRILVQNISNERILMSKRMDKVDRMKRNDAILKQKYHSTQEQHKEEKHQRHLLKQMKELRAKEIHKRHCEEKFVFDMIKFEKSCVGLQDAKRKAEVMKYMSTQQASVDQ
ncbi:PREDICTED: leucine-rich repeat and IQ domain-containing protein 3 [Dipodomys ordii]|uniref:Leucine-rich repeat and IQ domain-containing protein 3 n=1 Tax=Dipodomys ordii TaxID=10020 RepID=A0A1S3F6R3_DIPOR|nr:PREDICTED: leucine-rich repeat and IQ domain-containing protein 3 [Dipodomys ordii]